MKKTLLLSAMFVAVAGLQAQVTKTVAEMCNFLDIQAEKATLTATVPTSTVSVTSENGSVFWGYAKTDGTESKIEWNLKDDYNTAIPMPELAGTLDTLKVGTMYRAASGGHIDLGAFTTTAEGKVTVYFQPNGDSDRGIKIEVGNLSSETLKGGAKLDGIRPGYAAELTIPAGSYAAGDVVITVVTNTCNVFGVNIENLAGGSFVSTPLADQIYFNGNEIMNAQGLGLTVYNMLGKVVRTANTDISMADMPAGIYVVRAEGVKGALKISK